MRKRNREDERIEYQKKTLRRPYGGQRGTLFSIRDTSMNELKRPSLKPSCLARPAINMRVIQRGRYSYNGKDGRHTPGQQKIRS